MKHILDTPADEFTEAKKLIARINGAKGGNARWSGKSKAERLAYGRALTEKRQNKQKEASKAVVSD